MKKIKLMLACLMLLAATYTQAQTTNFSGHWVINESKSDFGGQSHNIMYLGLDVSQTKTTLTVKGVRFADSPNKEQEAGLIYTLDGKETTQVLSNKRSMKATINWSADHKTLTRSSVYSKAGQPEEQDYQSIENWSLSVDGKTLFIDRRFITSSGVSITIQAYYEKK